MRLARLVGALAITTALASCGGQSSAQCERVDLKDEGGKAIDLSGDWSANDQGAYSLKQIESCLWWVGLSDFPGEDPGDTWANVFRGRISSDRKITGEFTDVRTVDKTTGTLTLRIETTDGQLVLRRESLTGPSFGGTFWERATPEE